MGAEREGENPEIPFHGLGQTDARIPADRQEMGDRVVGEDTQGDKVLQAPLKVRKWLGVAREGEGGYGAGRYVPEKPS